MEMPRTKLPPRQHWNKETIQIEVNNEFEEALKMVLDELKAIYRFEGNKLVMYESEFKHFLGFMKPVIDFCNTLKQKDGINDKS